MTNAPEVIAETTELFKDAEKSTFGFVKSFGFKFDSESLNKDETFNWYTYSRTYSNEFLSMKVGLTMHYDNWFKLRFGSKKLNFLRIHVHLNDGETNLFVDCFQEKMHPELADSFFSLADGELKEEMKRVLTNYKAYVTENLVEVLNGEKMYRAVWNREQELDVEEKVTAPNNR